MVHTLRGLKLILILGLFKSGVEGLQCQDGFVRHGSSCYHFSHDTETWVDAANVCAMIYGGFLAEVNDAVENNFLVSMSGRNNVDYWIGGSDLKVEGEWKWYHSNDPVSPNLWGPGGVASNSGGDENCLEIHLVNWNDDSCHKPQHYICEMTQDNVEIVG